jgi:hypothetical protein
MQMRNVAEEGVMDSRLHRINLRSSSNNRLAKSLR